MQSDRTSALSAGEIIPAPLLWAGSMLLGRGLGSLFNFSDIRAPGVEAIGWFILAFTGSFLFWCFLRFILERTAIVPFRPSKHLVITGLYKYSRNPMYVTLIAMQVGIALSSGYGGILLTLPLSVLVIHFWAILPEERYLRGRFGQEFESYCRQVRRWV